ncbi:nuclear transport factor 2 family protein [Aquimarina mytili]|uniref:Nuclear transport factor 2 family protein n=1 Tax=Aquimarina mytili TaxID=874423 RepID=A0A936ZR80_9FLAO|nr:nuclear transport factor 2 family protein [Aquimarina mytili]MBL0684164.1 nuclear transport factor 2 family protein [Aquimarina mytili]
MKTISVYILILILIIGCTSKEHTLSTGDQSQVIKNIIKAVNEKDANSYVAGFAENVEVYVESELKINGKEALQKNRAHHFEKYPKVYSQIQYLLEIDNKVIMHDKVWLDEKNESGQDIVEIFTFNNGKISRVDVVQPKNLFK